eukprot:CAMPEP_0176109164 /NCGR_PEP_ID=MMETSP0120_2-20121206/54805_1 /TAXON_ID=160619 /ORGANISM="Kryptoperidinium foliaceum, Strain CCMP 1326" /LENGTH=85 /DNA_ID=CAMNT_0017443343 /DNA_START=42 /DNA_END=296 /DNA_ORIENTATION=-
MSDVAPVAPLAVESTSELISSAISNVHIAVHVAPRPRWADLSDDDSDSVQSSTGRRASAKTLGICASSSLASSGVFERCEGSPES